VFDEVVGGLAGTLGAVQSLADGGVELFQRLPDVRLLQRLFARVMPPAQIEGLAAVNLVNPAREAWSVFGSAACRATWRKRRARRLRRGIGAWLRSGRNLPIPTGSKDWQGVLQIKVYCVPSFKAILELLPSETYTEYLGLISL